MHGYDMVQIDGGERPASSESRLLAIERSEMSERRASSEDGDGAFTLMCRRRPPKTSSENRLFVIECSERAKGEVRA